MNNIFNQDFEDFIEVLNQNQVEYILVGGYSVILHGYFRTTGDMDIWVKPTTDNYQKLYKAFINFEMPVFDMTKEKFLSTESYDVFTFGNPPICIDIITKIKGLEFEDTFKKSEWFEVKEDLKVRSLNLDSLLKAKKAAGRNKDLDDLENLTK